MGYMGAGGGDPVSAPEACSQCIVKYKFPLKVLGNVLSYPVLTVSYIVDLFC